MTQESVERVLGRLLTDDTFRYRFGESLQRACLEEGYQLSSEELRLIALLDLPTLALVAGSLDGGIKRFAVRDRNNGQERAFAK